MNDANGSADCVKCMKFVFCVPAIPERRLCHKVPGPPVILHWKRNTMLLLECGIYRALDICIFIYYI